MASKRTLISLGILFLCAFCFGGGVFFTHHQIKASGEDYLRHGDTVNINVADEETMVEEAGIGPVTAGRIIASRETDGNFEDLHALVDRKIIGERMLEKIAPRIRVN